MKKTYISKFLFLGLGLLLSISMFSQISHNEDIFEQGASCPVIYGQFRNNRLTVQSDNQEAIDLTRSNRIVILFFTADWCGPCRMLSSTALSPLKAEYSDNPDISFIDILDEGNQSILEYFNITQVPTPLFFKEGELIHREIGVKPKDNIKVLIEELSSGLNPNPDPIVNKSITTTYSYNIRSWTKSIEAKSNDSSLFNQTLYYNEQTGTNVPQYGGNWKNLLNLTPSRQSKLTPM